MSVSAPPPPADDLNALPAGTRFGELELQRLIGSGGFGLVYLAKDHALDRLVAVKEYMPGSLAQRTGGSKVSVRSASAQETFEIGLRSFVNEARLLARFDHRSLLKVYRFWEANGTAYLCMPYLQGVTLKEWRETQGRAPDAQWLLRLLLPMLDALGQLHAAGVVHRDVAPDNIYLPADGGDAILLDFGAARRAIGDRTQTLTAIIKPSYAPLEQYDGACSLKQGPWTDLYALAAVVHYLITGRTPPAATRRALDDDYAPLSAQLLPGYPEALLAAVDWALALKPADRPQSVGQFRDALLGHLDVPVSVVRPPRDSPSRPEPTVPSVMQFEPTQLLVRDEAVADARSAPVPPAPAPVAEPAGQPPLAAAALARATPPAAAPQIAAAPAPTPAASVARRPAWLLPGVLVAGALLAAFWALVGGSRTEPSPAEDLFAEGELVSAPASAAASTGALVAKEVSAVAPVAAGSAARPASAPAVAQASAPAAAPVRVDSGKGVKTAAVRPDVSPQADSGATRVAGAAPRGETTVKEALKASDPQAACEGRRFLALMLCVDRKCAEPAYAQHPECVRLREIREQRDHNRGR
jgi:serine/threonine protein kinase